MTMSNPDDLWIQPCDWREYEHYVFGTLRQRFPNSRILPNTKLPGLKSGRSRQIDMLVEFNIGGCLIRIAFDCKCYGRKVDVKHVESFLGMLEDIRVSQGVLVTTKGYTKTALSRAQRESRDIDLQILPPDRLSEYQFIGCAWFWKGGAAAIVEPPKGWVVDVEDPAGPAQFSMYPLGYDRKSAMKMCPFLYGAIVPKTEATGNMEAIATEDERVVIARYPNARFERMNSPTSGLSHLPPNMLLRIGRVDPSYGGPEYSLYVDMPKTVLRLVLLCPSGQDEIYLPVLEWVGRGAITMSRNDEGNEPLTPKEMNVVGCTLFPRGMRESLLTSGDRGLMANLTRPMRPLTDEE